MTPDLQEDVYQAVYDLCMAALNPSYDPGEDPENPAVPAVPVIRDQQDQNAPTEGLFIAIQASPTLEAQGTIERRDQDDEGERALVQVYAGTCILREVNGNGSALTRVRDFSETESVREILESKSLSIVDFGDVTESSFNLENRWIAQAFMPLEFTIASATHEILPIIESVEYTGP